MFLRNLPHLSRLAPLALCRQKIAATQPWLLMLLLFAAGCGPANEFVAAPTEAATVVPTVAPTVAAQATATPPPLTVEFWITERQPARVAGYRAVAQRFMAAHPDIALQIVPVDEATILQNLQEAAAGNWQPALARIGVERLPALAEAGLLDLAATQATLDTLARDNFRTGPLNMVTNALDGQVRAIPADGWLQALWFRRDLFEAQGLTSPATWEQLNAACDAFAALPTESSTVAYALALPSDPTSNYAHQVFEQVAISNGAWLFDADGQPAMNAPAMVEALRFYTELARCAPQPPVDALRAADSYLRGESAMLFYSTYIMDDFVDGVERVDGAVVLPVFADLAERTGFASSLAGPNGTASYGQVVTLAILRDAPPETQAVVRFLMTEGYADLLRMAPLGKVPVRTDMTETWTTLSPTFARYSPATLGHIVNSYDLVQRWSLQPGISSRLAAAGGTLEGRLLVPQALMRIFNGEMTPESAAEWLQAQLVEILAGS
jgi:multiple sugar transport system substrate-binding protein